MRYIKYLLIVLTLILCAANLSFGAKGDKPAQRVATFGNVSTAAVACTAGELRYNSTYLFICNEANLFKRYSGASF